MTTWVVLSVAWQVLWQGGMQVWEFTLSIFWSSLFHSCWSLKKCECEGIALIDLLKRATMNEALSISLKKEQCQWFNHDLRESCFWNFFLLFMPKEWIAPVILHSFLKTNGINSLSLLFTKEQQWVNRSHHSLKKSDGRDSIPSFFEKSDRSDSLFFPNLIDLLLFQSQKTSYSLKKPKI